MSRPDRPEPYERQRAARAVELRTSGKTYAAVATELGYADESGARKAVDRLLSRIEHEGATALRAIECARLDALTAAHWQAAIGGDIDASKVLLQVIDRRAKLLGLNSPTGVQVVRDEIGAVEFAERMAELIGELRPDTLRAMFMRTPEAAVVFDAAKQTGASESDTPEGISTACGQRSGEIGPVAAGSSDGWSNIGPEVDVRAPQPEPRPMPAEATRTHGHIPMPPRAVDPTAQWRRRLGG